MKSFKGYLKEDAPAWQSSTSQKIFDFGQIDYMQIPLTSSTMEWIFQVQIPRATVFHVTNAIGLEKLKRLQNKKKSISAFFNMDASTMDAGIQGGGGLVVELDANIIMSSKSDLMSMPDKTGRRWVELYNIDPKGKMHTELEKMLIDLAIKHDPKNKEYLKISPEIGIGVWYKLQSDFKDDGKKMSLIIADYIDGVNTILKKHKNDIQGAIHGYIVRRGTVAVKHPSGRMVGGDSEISEWDAWDEQVVDKIKIEKVHTFNTATRPFEWIDDSVIPRLGRIPHKHWKSATELSTYISQVADAEVRTFGGWARKK
tara:strand:- start:3 stop:941 length:939 start_codon:yes stop_codon:yes gene_type:complete